MLSKCIDFRVSHYHLDTGKFRQFSPKSLTIPRTKFFKRTTSRTCKWWNQWIKLALIWTIVNSLIFFQPHWMWFPVSEEVNIWWNVQSNIFIGWNQHFDPKPTNSQFEKILKRIQSNIALSSCYPLVPERTQIYSRAAYLFVVIVWHKHCRAQSRLRTFLTLIFKFHHFACGC